MGNMGNMGKKSAKKDDGERKRNFNEFHLADIIMKINSSYPGDIEKQTCIMNIIDYQFQKRTRLFFILQLFFFAIMCVVPFTADLLMKGHHKDMLPIRQVLNSMFLISILVLFYFEYVNYKQVGTLRKYFSSDNKYDVAMLFIMFVVIILRYVNGGFNWIPNDTLQA